MVMGYGSHDWSRRAREGCNVYKNLLSVLIEIYTIYIHMFSLEREKNPKIISIPGGGVKILSSLAHDGTFTFRTEHLITKIVKSSIDKKICIYFLYNIKYVLINFIDLNILHSVKRRC